MVYTITGFVGGEDTSVLTAQPVARTSADGKTADTFDITVSGAEADNYDFTYEKGTLTVVDHVHNWSYTAQGSTITAACGNAATCDKATQTITLVAPTGSTVYDGEIRSASIDGSIDGVTTPEITYTGDCKSAGTHTASIRLGDAEATVNFTIDKATVNVTADAKSRIYGEVNPELTYKADTLVEGNSFTGNLATTATAASAVGEYDITIGTLSAGENYNINFTGAKLTVVKAAAPDIQWPSAASLTYGQKLSESALTSQDTNGIFAWKDGSIVPTVNNNGYSVVYTPKDAKNYDYANVTLEKTVSVTVGKAAPDVTVPTGMTAVYGQTLANVILPNGWEWVNSNASVGDAGTHTFEAVFTPEDTANYNTRTEDLTVNVEQKAVAEPTVGSIHTYTGTEQTVTLNGVESYMTVASGDKGTNAGSYEVNITLDNNHKWANGSDGKIQWTIAKAQAAITVDTNPINVTYGDTVTLPTATANFGTVTCNKTAADLKNAGTYTVTYSVAGTGNYDGDTVSITVTVTAKAVTVKADAVSKTYGEADPELTYTVSGLVNGDPITVVLERAQGENVGTYAIAQKTLDAGRNYTVTYTGADLSIAKRNVTVTAKDQTITYGQSISGEKYTVTNMVSGHSAEAILTAGTAKVTASSTITASGAVITADGVDVTANYAVAYVPGGLVIRPDTAAIDDLTTANVTSADEADIQAVKKMMEEAESTEEAWDTILGNCGDLLKKIQEVEAENSRIEKLADKYALESVKSSDEADLEGLKSDIEKVLATDNITDEERNNLKGLKTKVTDLLARINGTKELLDQLDKTMKPMDEETIKSTDQAALEQVIKDAQTLIDSEYITEEEREALKQLQETARDLIQTIENTAEAKQEAANAADTFDADAVKSTDKAALEDLTKDVQALLDTTNLTEAERESLEELLAQVQDMIDAIQETAKKSEEASGAISAVNPETVTSADKDELQQAIDTIDALLKDDHLTEAERKALTEAKNQAEALLDTIRAVKDALVTDNTEKVEDVTAGNVQLQDKKDLQAARTDLAKALADNGSHYTETEKQAIQSEIDRIQAAIQAVENVESLENDLYHLPESVEPDDEAMEQKILAAKAAYDALTEHEKTLVDQKTVKKLNSLIYDLTDYKIVKGAEGKWMKGDNNTLTFTANGPFRKFVGIEVDGKPVRERNYTAKAGSTIITLKESYLKGLEDGLHTLTVKFEDGETFCNFRILPKTAAPATGDVSDITLWTSGMLTSVLALAVVLLLKKKNAVK